MISKQAIRSIGAAVGICIIVLAPGDSRADKKKKKQEQAVSQMTKVGAHFPTLTPLGDTSASQTKGGITIAVAPVEYNLTTAYESRVRQTNPSFKEGFILPHQPTDIFVERTCMPMLKVTPDRIRFQVTASNQIPCVSRGGASRPVQCCW